jgi:uncharacterized protein YdhG (YjbR/CyaY superfamily)
VWFNDDMTRSPRTSSSRPTTIDAYLARLDEDQRGALQSLRATIRNAAPKAEECISYGLPAFKQDGVLVAFGASAKHLSLFPMNGTTVGDFKKDLAGFSTSKGTIRFTPAKPLPASLVRKIVKARLKENKADRGTPR